MKSALESSWLDYEHINTVVVQGTTVVLAREAPSEAIGSDTIESPFCFNVLSPAAAESGGHQDWVGFQRLRFPNELRPVGMELVKVLGNQSDNQYLIPVADAGGRFCAVPFGEFIYLFRRSTDGTLLSTRFRLVRAGSTVTPDRVSYSLESPWDVRFQDSQSPESPANDPTTQNHLSLSSEPFHEPTVELSMIRGLSNGYFDVEIVPVAGGRAMCHVYKILSDRSKTRMSSIPIDESGQYDLQGLR